MKSRYQKMTLFMLSFFFPLLCDYAALSMNADNAGHACANLSSNSNNAERLHALSQSIITKIDTLERICGAVISELTHIKKSMITGVFADDDDAQKVKDHYKRFYQHTSKSRTQSIRDLTKRDRGNLNALVGLADKLRRKVNYEKKNDTYKNGLNKIYSELFNLYERTTTLKLINPFISEHLDKIFYEYVLSFFTELIRETEQLLTMLGLPPNKKVNCSYIKYVLEDISSEIAPELYIGKKESIVTCDLTHNNMVDKISNNNQKSNHEKRKKKNSISEFMRKNPDIANAVKESQTIFISADNRAVVTSIDKNQSSVSGSKNNEQEDNKEDWDDEDKEIISNADLFKNDDKDLTHASDVNNTKLKNSKKKNQGRRGKRARKWGNNLNHNKTPVNLIPYTIKSPLSTKVRDALPKVCLTKSSRATFEHMSNKSYPTKVNKFDFQNLISDFISMNLTKKGEKETKYLKGVSGLKSKENHTNNSNILSHEEKKISIIDGMSILFTRIDNASAFLNIHYPHTKDAGKNKIPKAYREEYMQAFDTFNIKLEDIEICKHNNL